MGDQNQARASELAFQRTAEAGAGSSGDGDPVDGGVEMDQGSFFTRLCVQKAT